MAYSRAGEALFRLAVTRRLPPRPHTVASKPLPCREQLLSSRKFTTTHRNRDISPLLDITLGSKRGTPTRTATGNPLLKSRDAQQKAGSQGISNEIERVRSSELGSVDALLEKMVKRNTGPSTKRASASYGSADIYRTFNGSNRAQPLIEKDVEPVILPPNVGRLIEVDEKRGMDVGRAFRMMERHCQRNRVRASFAQQRFHERPGLKRKRLANQRWLKRFKENFIGTVKMVQKMQKQGW